MSIAEDRVAIRLDRFSNGMVLSPEEFDEVSDYDGLFRYELIHRVVIVNPIPSEGETDPNEELGSWLRYFRRAHPQGAALDATMPERYVRTIDSRRRADRVIWAGLARRPDPRCDMPTVVVEFVSRRQRDRLGDYGEKRQDYLAAGVMEYWIIDRFRRCMTVCRPGEADLLVGEQDVYRTSFLPGFELPLGKLLEVADRWRDLDSAADAGAAEEG